MYADTRTGPWLVLGHLASLGGAALLLLVHVALGARLRRALGAGGRVEAMWRWPVDAALGIGVLAMAMFVVGAIGVLTPAVVLGLTVLLAVLAQAELRVAAKELATLFAPSRAGAAAEARWAALPRALLTVLVLLLIAAALAPPTEWDSLAYHLRVPLFFLERGRIALPPDSFHVALVGASHLSTLPLLAAGFLVGPALMQVAALVLTLMGTMALARAAGAARFGRWLAGAAVLGCPVFVLVAITARVDVTLVLVLLAAHLVLLEADDDASARLLPEAALLIGTAMAIKPQAGAYAIALLPLGWRAARGWRPAAGAAGLATLIAAPWYLKNQLLVGAPFYPKGAPGWFEPWIAELFGGRVRPASVDASVLQALPEARESFSLLDAFFAPDRLTIEGEGAFYALSPALLLVPVVLLAWRTRRRAASLALVGIGYIALVVVPFGQINLRYLMPAVPALAVATAVAAEWFGERFSADARRLLAAVLTIAAVLPLSGTLRQRFFTGDGVLLRHAMGLSSAQEVWRRHPDGTARGYAPVIARVQRLVPPDGRVLMLWEARALPFERDVLADLMLSNWSFLAQSPAPERCLAGTGITHILTGTGSVEYYVTRGADPKAFLLDRFAAFRERCLIAHAVVGPGFDLFAVRPTAP